MVPPELPGGQETILALHVGGFEFQLKEAPVGVETSVMLVDVPEQMDLVNGGLTLGRGLIVTAREEVGPGSVQLELVPYTCIFPEVAFAAKFTMIKASVGLVWMIVAPVPV